MFLNSEALGQRGIIHTMERTGNSIARDKKVVFRGNKMTHNNRQKGQKVFFLSLKLKSSHFELAFDFYGLKNVLREAECSPYRKVCTVKKLVSDVVPCLATYAECINSKL